MCCITVFPRISRPAEVGLLFEIMSLYPLTLDTRYTTLVYPRFKVISTGTVHGGLTRDLLFPPWGMPR